MTITKEELRDEIEYFTRPVDYEKLIEDGFLEKTNYKNKYKILKELPDEVNSKIRGISQTSKGSYITIYNNKKLASLRKKIIAT